MREVYLDGRRGPLEDEALKRRLAGHLRARLAEYAEEGIRARLEGGDVLAAFPGFSGAEAADFLAERGVFALPDGEEVRFRPGPGVSFEALDYVQAAAAEML